jgi:hypothetical protein
MSGAYFFMTHHLGNKFYNELIGLCKNLSIPLDMGEPELEIMQEWKSLYIENLLEKNIMITMKVLA